MNVTFDILNRRRNPSLILCNPNGEELFSLAMAKNRELSISLNAVSELTFQIPKYGNSDEVTPYYELIKTKRIVKLEEFGQFVITNVDIISNGVTEVKQITCKGLEFELSSKNLDVLEGTYALYNPTETQKSLLHIILGYIPTWSIESVDSELWNTWRTFDIKDNNIFNFLMSEVQTAFDCVLIFNTFNRTIKVVKTSNLPKQTDVYLSSRNLMKELNITENADNITTALTVYGDGDLSIRTVNPLGTATIYDFSYYAKEEWMSKDLILAVNLWQEKVKNAETPYANKLIEIKNLTNDLDVLKNELVNLETEKKVLEQKHSLAVVAGDNENCTLYATQIEAKKNEISVKESQITQKESEINLAQSALNDITKSLSFQANFTIDQLKELDKFIYQNSIQNTNYSTTSLTTIEEQRQIVYDLYNWAKGELKKGSQPIWEFNVDSVNFLNLIEYKDVTDQLELGCEITIEVDKEKDLYAKAMLVGYNISLDDFSSLELSFSSCLRFNSGSYTFEELFDQTASISKSFDFESNNWNLGKDANTKIDEYINSALDLTTKEIISSDNQEFTMTNVGIRGREYLPLLDKYSPEEIWINKNVIAFSDDNFNTTKTALGKITLPNGSKAYGLIGEYIVGRMLCGKTLVLENEKSTFRVDDQGVYIKDANIIMTSESGQELSIPDLIAKSTEKIDNVLTPSGLLDTNKLQGQILAGTNNIFCVNSTNNKALLMNDTGILISNKKANGDWVWTTAISADGISADVIQANGTLSGVNIVGGSLNVGNSAFTVDTSGNVGITRGTINMGNGAFTLDSYGNINVTKGSINLGNGAFNVDSYGNIKITQGSINIGDGAFSVNSYGSVIARDLTLTNNTKGEIDANNLKINNLVVGGNVSMGANATITWDKVTSKPDDLASINDIPTNSEIQGIASTTITSELISSPRIVSPSIEGGTITGGTIIQSSPTVSNWGNCELVGGRLQLKDKSNNYLGAVMGDDRDKKMWVEGMNALKLVSYNGDISIQPKSVNGDNNTTGNIWLYGKVVVRGGKIVDENDKPIVGGSSVATFG